MTVVDLDTARRYWVQPTTGMTHARRSCSVARRSRYGLAPIDLTDAELAARHKKCKRCLGA